MKRDHLRKLITLHAIAFVGVFLFPVGAFAQEQFVPLTSLPGVSDLANTNTELISGDSLPAFFNSLYRLCIGAAAVIAVVQIIRAGIKFMTNKESVSANKDAKEMLWNAVFGVILVLSPVIVFGIINPDILRLDLNLQSLQIENQQEPLSNIESVLWYSQKDQKDWAAEAKRCEQGGGTASFACVKDQQAKSVSITQACAAGETGFVYCRSKEATTVTDKNMCRQYDTQYIPQDKFCNAETGYQALPTACCGAGGSPGALCCGKPKATEQN